MSNWNTLLRVGEDKYLLNAEIINFIQIFDVETREEEENCSQIDLQIIGDRGAESGY